MTTNADTVVVISILGAYAPIAQQFLPRTDSVVRSLTRDYHLFETPGFVDPPTIYADEGTSLIEIWSFGSLDDARAWIAADIRARIGGSVQ
jgi:hypothetical protein